MRVFWPYLVDFHCKTYFGNRHIINVIIFIVVTPKLGLSFEIFVTGN